MATTRQVEANRRNALHSTGPKTDEGKAQSRRNALKHGLAGHGVVFPDETADAIADRMADWRKDFRPDSPCQEWLFTHLCTESIRIDACLHQEIALSDELALRAAETWDNDRALAAAELMVKLCKRPEVVQKQLLQSKQGCETVIAAWKVIEIGFQKRGGWNPTAWSRALDLLGVAIEARGLREPTEAEGLEWISRQIQELEQLQAEILDARDTREQADAKAGLSAAEPPSLRRIRRYESAATRKLQWAWRQLTALQKAPPPAPPKPVEDLDDDDFDFDFDAQEDDTPLSVEEYDAEVLRDFEASNRPIATATLGEMAAAMRRQRPAAPADNRHSRRARQAQARRA